MSNFITDNTGVPIDKINLGTLPPGANPRQWVVNTEWITAMQALLDVQAFCRGAPWLGMTANGADPVPSGIDKYLWLKSDGTLWKTVDTVAEEVGGGGGAVGFFGDGFNGDLDLDGVNNYAGVVSTPSIVTALPMAASLTQYSMSTSSLQGDIYCDNLIIRTGVFLNFNGCRLFVKDTLTLETGAYAGLPGNNGLVGTAGGGGVGGATGNPGTVAGRAGGGTGAAPAGGTNNGVAVTSAYRGFSTTAANGTNTTGQSGGVGHGGGGGGNGTAPGGNSGAVSIAAATSGSPHDFETAYRGRLINAFTLWPGGSGGGGGRGVNSGNGGGGGGGAGGGYGFISAGKILGAGALTAQGGNGGDAYQGSITGGQGCGGGGGAGGGLLVVFLGTGTFPMLIVTGGTGGLLNGTGGDGGSGGAGVIFQHLLGT